MGAIIVHLRGPSDGSVASTAGQPAASHDAYQHLAERCIGCGLCVLACDRQRALVMEPVPDYRLPYRSWFSLISHAAPGVLLTTLKVWRQRRSFK